MKKKEAEPIINIWGYRNEQEVANDVYSSIMLPLLQGNLVFAYRGSGKISKLVITRKSQDVWMIGIITPGWSCVIPKAPIDYLKTDILKDISEIKDSNILNNYRRILESE